MQRSSLGLGGCSNKVDAATTLPLVNESRPVVVESEEPTSSAEETTVVETVSGTIESAEEQPEQAEDSVCLFGPATQMEDGRLSIDSQADQGYQGEVILNVFPGVYLCIRRSFRSSNRTF